MRKKPAKTYCAYLLRLWRDSEHEPWRGTVEDPHTGVLHGFADLEALFAFLRGQTGQPDRPDKQSLTE